MPQKGRILVLSLLIATSASLPVQWPLPASAQKYTQVFPSTTNPTSVQVAPAQALPTQATPVNPPTGLQSGITHYAERAVLQTPKQILDELKQANGIPADLAPRITVQQSNTLNAATNGQDIVITSALLNQLKTNDQRAFVISHELSHITLNHIARTQIRRVGLSLLDTLLLRRYINQGSLGELAKNLGFTLYDKRSGRVYEYQADDVGIQLMNKAGYNPQGAIEVFKILEEATPGNRVPEFFQDHPITAARIEALVRKYKLSGN